VVETVGDVEREFVVHVAAGGAFLHGPVDVDDEVAGPFVGFAGDGIVAKADDVGGAVLSKIFAVGLGDAFVVNEYNGDFVPAGGRGFGFEFFAEPISQPLNLFQFDRLVFLSIYYGCFHGLWGRGCGREACW